MTVVPFRTPRQAAPPVLMAGPWLDRKDALGPCRLLGQEIVAMVYGTGEGRWSWIVNSLGRTVSSESAAASRGEAQRLADGILAAHGLNLA